jgi:hypothetical protein
MRHDSGQIPTHRQGRKMACGSSKESERPLSRFPLRGKAGAGGFPHADSTLRGQQKALARIVRRLPPQEGCRPLVDPLRARYAGIGNLRDTRESRDITRSPSADICRDVYTKYLTLPLRRIAM